jgi:predicted RNase H-like HicB family nuclease
MLKPRHNLPMSSFAVVIHEEASGGFWGEVPALPGCYSQGETVQDLLANLREAIAGTLEVMKEEGTTPESNVQILEVAV